LLRLREHAGGLPARAHVDQWFDEAQFESYRALGRHVVGTLTARRRARRGGAVRACAALRGRGRGADDVLRERRVARAVIEAADRPPTRAPTAWTTRWRSPACPARRRPTRAIAGAARAWRAGRRRDLPAPAAERDRATST
jgi:hypothetical protein